MSFDAPSALWLLLLLIPAAAICFARLTPDGIIPSRLLFGKREKRLNKRLLARLCILCAMGCVIVELAGPRFQGRGGAGQGEGVAALLLDLSGSMEARGLKAGAVEPTEENLAETRLELAKSITLELLEKLPERNIALIAFARRAFIVSPVTRSMAPLKERVSALEVLEYEDGTAIGDALICACRTLEQASSSAVRRIYLVSDGADHSDDESRKEAVGMLQKAGIAVYPIIVGADYRFHPIRDSKGSITWQEKGEQADVTMIETLASDTGGRILTAEKIDDEARRLEKATAMNGIWLCLAALCVALAGVLG
ncbi:MAG: VWA domain-containing protein [Victivallales bacterium]|nr:VWA domain-containing protein [Victivallales bacterium]